MTNATHSQDRGSNRDAATACLQEIFGYEAFRPLQGEAIEALLDGRDVVLLLPTGGGKSLCYQIPALVGAGVGIVISPLIALMQDQVDLLAQLGVEAGFLNSTQSPGERSATLSAVRSGRMRLLYLAPERLAMAETQSLLSGLPVSVVAIDEAHCVSQWGHDFRPDYLAIDAAIGAVAAGARIPRIALTATATPQTRDDMIERLGLREPLVLEGGFDRPNIRYRVAERHNGRQQLLNFLADHRQHAGIVYCLSRRKVERVAEQLADAGFRAEPYHAGLPTEQRAATQRRFLTGDIDIVVATIAFGMGIDKPDVRFVAHLDLPRSVEAYYQETGRAGRDGEPAEAWMAYGMQDVVRLRRMLDESDGDEAFKRIEQRKLNALLGWCEATGCRRRPLLAYFGQRLDADCGNCDNCLSPPPSWDATEAAQQLLSAVYRTGQRFGANYVIDVLRGSSDERMQRYGHDRLALFGVGAERSHAEWQSLTRQLVVAGLLVVDAARHGALVLDPSCRPLLRGETGFEARALRRAERRRQPRAGTEDPDLGTEDAALFDALRECRAALARAHDIPAYMVFHDATLRDMARHRPQDRASMLAISGVGNVKFDRFGGDFLNTIAEHVSDDASAPAAQDVS